jgi:hypothetical protein
MRKFLLGLVASLGLGLFSASAQTVTTPGIEAIACTQNAVLPSIASGQFGFANCDPFGRLYTTGIAWTPIGAYSTPLSVTTTSASTLLPSGQSVVIYNTGANNAYVKFGLANTVIATTADDVIPAGGGCGFYVTPNLYVAALTSISTTTINVSGGSGMAPGCWGGSGSSGGAASNVAITSPLGTNSIAASVAVTPATSSVWSTSLTAQTPEAPGAATATTGLQLGGTYSGSSPAPALTTGQQGAVSIDQNGALNTGFDGAQFTPASVTSAAVIFTQDMTGYIGLNLQVTSIGTSTITFECSEDNSTWYNTSGTSSSFLIAAQFTQATAQLILLNFPKRARYFRARVSTYVATNTITVVYSLNKSSSIIGIGGTIAAQGINANATTVVANPVLIGHRAETSDLSLSNGQAAFAPSDLRGVPIYRPYAIPESTWQSTAGASGMVNTTTPIQLAPAGAAGIRNYCTGITIASDSLGAATEIVILDGATVIWRSKIQITTVTPTTQFRFDPPLRGTAATAMNFNTLTMSVTGGVYVNAQGFIAP